MKTLLVLTLAVFLAACGYLSNDAYFQGEGVVEGRILLEGEPASGALVFLLGEPERKTISDEQGSFSLIAPAGRNREVVTVWGITHGARTGFDLAGDGRVNLGNVELGFLGLLEGQVSYEHPTTVTARILGTPFVSRIDWQGRYRFSLPGGEWQVSVQAEGAQAVSPITSVISPPGISKVPSLQLKKDPDYTCTPGHIDTELYYQAGGGMIDILFVIDGSGSMAGEQVTLARSFRSIAESLSRTDVDFHLAVITPGIVTPGCPRCDEIFSANCINETGESGRFQDLLGYCGSDPFCADVSFIRDPSCRVVTRENVRCLYDEEIERGLAIVGTNGCGYERPLAAMRLALQPDMLSDYNAGFLREQAKLAVVTFSDEEDCGEVEDIVEGTMAGGNICYYSAKGVDPEGNTVYPGTTKPYQLTPVGDYYDFLLALKSGRPGLVVYSAVTGVKDPEHPETTVIEYEPYGDRYRIKPACQVAGCEGESFLEEFCMAYPGTRHVALAELTYGFIGSICVEDFSRVVLQTIGEITSVRRQFVLSATPADEHEIVVEVDRQPVGGWTFIKERPAILFEESSIPAKYSQVEIKYPALCH